MINCFLGCQKSRAYSGNLFFFFFILIEGLLQFVMVSAIYQHEMDIGTYVSPPILNPLTTVFLTHPFRLSQALTWGALPDALNSHW